MKHLKVGKSGPTGEAGREVQRQGSVFPADVQVPSWLPQAFLSQQPAEPPGAKTEYRSVTNGGLTGLMPGRKQEPWSPATSRHPATPPRRSLPPHPPHVSCRPQKNLPQRWSKEQNLSTVLRTRETVLSGRCTLQLIAVMRVELEGPGSWGPAVTIPRRRTKPPTHQQPLPAHPAPHFCG